MQFNLRYTLLSAAILGFVAHSPARADDLIEGAKMCTQYLPHYEREYGIPTQLLSAIASTESGRYHEGLGIRVPWPWTIDAEGKSYYYPSKAEAVAAAHQFMNHGIQSIDVGCMQINLFHHPHAFSSVEEAFEPQNNVAYAASFLRGLYQEDGNWKKAAADYHSKTPALGIQYVNQVYDSWYKIISKLRDARMQIPGTTAVAAQLAMNDPQPVPLTKIHALPEQDGKKVAAYEAPHMKVIELSTKEQDASDMVVLREPAENTAFTTSQSERVPQQQPQTLTVAQAPESITVPEAKIIHVSDAVAMDPSRKAGPNFIFND